MAKCEFCGQEIDMPFKCSFCHGNFCIEHRLPENHMCLKSPPRTPLGPWKAKKAPVPKIGKIPRVHPPKTQTIQKPSKKRQNIKKIAIVGLILIGILALSMLTIFILRYQPSTAEETFDIRAEIAKLQSERPSWDQYSILEYDWKVWKRQAEAAGSTFVEMNNWDEFKESLNQNSHVWVLTLDEENRVIWYTPAPGFVIHFHY